MSDGPTKVVIDLSTKFKNATDLGETSKGVVIHHESNVDVSTEDWENSLIEKIIADVKVPLKL